MPRACYAVRLLERDMTEALDQHLMETQVGGGRGSVPLEQLVTTDDRPLREELRRQIARLEQQLSELWTAAFPRKGIDWSVGAVGGPRILGAAELERIRDALLVRIREAQTELGRRADVEERNRGLVERMIAEPERYPWVQISNEDVGDRDCKHWHSRPRWGILGMLLGWWRVKLSSGCPLAKGACPSLPRWPRNVRSGPAAPARPRLRRRRSRPSRARRRSASARLPRTRARRRRGARSPWSRSASLAGLILVIVGLIIGTDRGALAIGVGIGLAALGGLELAIREHFAGYRSHSVAPRRRACHRDAWRSLLRGARVARADRPRGDRRGRLRRGVLRLHGDVQAQGGRRVQAALTPACAFASSPGRIRGAARALRQASGAGET